MVAQFYLWPEKSTVKTHDRNNTADTKVSEKGKGGGVLQAPELKSAPLSNFLGVEY